MLSVRKNGYRSFKDVSPLGSAEFLKDFDKIITCSFNCKSSDEALRPESKFFIRFKLQKLNAIFFSDIQYALNWLCAWLLEHTGQRLDSLKLAGKSTFEARNEIQIFHAKTLSIVFAEVILQFLA